VQVKVGGAASRSAVGRRRKQPTKKMRWSCPSKQGTPVTESAVRRRRQAGKRPQKKMRWSCPSKQGTPVTKSAVRRRRQAGKRGAGSSSDGGRSAVVKKGGDAGEMSGGSCKWRSEVQVAGGARKRRRSRWGRAGCRYQMSSGSCKWRSEVQVAGGAQKQRRSRWGRGGCR
jgi:hypothetical protein